MKRCLYCYKELKNAEADFHPSCAKKIFGADKAPELPYTRENLDELAKRVVAAQTTIAGVQPKLSMHLDKALRGNSRLTIVGLWGDYILKPQAGGYGNLPENEDLSMHLAEIAGIKTVPHSLIRFSDGELCYITKRIDRGAKGEKIPMEDMAQLTLRLSEDKYKSSYEQIAKTVRKYSANTGFDLLSLAEQILFSWLIGNSDMHLKNFSLIKGKGGWKLAPAYDMLNTKLVLPSDKEELALVLNGKGADYKYRKSDFRKAFLAFGLETPIINNLFERFLDSEKRLCEFIEKGFLPEQKAMSYREIVSSRMDRLRENL